MGPQVQPKCSWHAKHMRNNWELRKRGYLIRIGHTEALLLKKKRTLNGHFSRPAETDPYMHWIYEELNKDFSEDSFKHLNCKAEKHTNGWFHGSTNLFVLMHLVCPICDTDSAGAPQCGVKVIRTQNMCVAQRHISRLRQCLTNLPIVTLCSSTERRQMLLSVHDYVHVVAFNQT